MSKGGVMTVSLEGWIAVRRGGRLVGLLVCLAAVALIGTALTPPAAQAALDFNESFTGSTLNVPGDWAASGSSGFPCLTARTSAGGGGNPLVLASGNVFGCTDPALDTAGGGALRLTSTGGGLASTLVYTKPQGTGDGLDITFNLAMYGGSGADGISFYLKKGDSTKYAAGDPGGSLGYTNAPDALLGIGFDRFGNFSTIGSAGTGCTTAGVGFRANAIAVRGPGDAGAGYCYLGGTEANAVNFQATTRAGGTKVIRIVIDKRTVTDPRVRVFVDNGPEPVVDIAQPAELKAALDFKFGFSGSTGGSTNNHEIWGFGIVPPTPVSIATTSPLPNGVASTAYSSTLATASGVGPFTWAVTAGALPGGLTLSSSGVLSGTPTTPGVYSFTATVTDAQATTAAREFQVTVVGNPDVTTSAASNIGPNSATLNGSVIANFDTTTGSFCWGTAADLTDCTTATVPGSFTGGAAQTATTTIAGLTPQTTYYFRLSATNSQATSAGSIQSFRTRAPGTDPVPGPGPAPAPAPEPAPIPTARPLPSPSSLDPVTGSDNPNFPADGLPLGGSLLLVDGKPEGVTVRPNSDRDPTALVVEGPGFTMRLAGRTADNRPLGLTPDGALILEQDRTAFTEGTGFRSDSQVFLYLLSAPRFLGTVATDTEGTFRGSVPLPMDIPAGRHTLQANGFTPDGKARSLSLGVLVQAAPKQVGPQRARTTVYFAALSSRLDATARKSLNALVKGRNKVITRVVVNGFVQGSDSTANDQALSLARAQSVARYLKSQGVTGKVVVRANGVAKETGAAGRKAVVRITYQR